jgi:hypothetical protein
MHTLGPTGYGSLVLGMTRSQAIATGLTDGTAAGAIGSCGQPGDGVVGGTPTDRGSSPPTVIEGQLFFSSTTGHLVAIYAYPGVKTPQGIEIGSSYAQLHAAYPDWFATGGDGTITDGHSWAMIPGNPNAHLRIATADGKVAELSLDDNHQDCYE